MNRYLWKGDFLFRIENFHMASSVQAAIRIEDTSSKAYFEGLDIATE